MKPKIFSYYLPQFHEIEENNLWWGEGFTEWTNLRKAKKLFKNHKILYPKNSHYYDLSDPKTIEWQIKIAKDHSISGFAYYHYWFNGRKILEKPAEKFLSSNNLQHEYYFMWANHDWTRSWVGNNKQMLIKQTYGSAKDWEDHFNYLLPFFEDKRYLKINGMPVFEIYIPKDIPKFDEMIELWNSLAKLKNFPGIYLVEHHDYLDYVSRKPSIHAKAVTYQQHSMGLVDYLKNKSLPKKVIDYLKRKFSFGPAIYDYEEVSKYVMKFNESIEINSQFDVVLQSNTGWDNTPRYGKRGYVLNNCSDKLFKDNLLSAYNIACKNNWKILNVACWNEWAEGMVLEPSEQFGNKYLEAVKDVVKPV